MSNKNFVEHLRTAASVKYYLYIVDFVIISYTVFFCGSEVHLLLIPFPKESIKVKKVSNLKGPV